MNAKQTNTNFKFPGDEDGWLIPVPGIHAATKVAYTSASAAMAATLAATFTNLDQNYIVVRLTATTDCFITAATSPTALADGTHHYLPAGVPQDFKIFSGYKLAAISNGSDGTLFITALG